MRRFAILYLLLLSQFAAGDIVFQNSEHPEELEIAGAQFSQDSVRIAVAYETGSIQSYTSYFAVWDVESQEQVVKTTKSGIQSDRPSLVGEAGTLAFSTDGKILGTFNGVTFRTWSIQDGTMLWESKQTESPGIIISTSARHNEFAYTTDNYASSDKKSLGYGFTTVGVVLSRSLIRPQNNYSSCQSLHGLAYMPNGDVLMAGNSRSGQALILLWRPSVSRHPIWTSALRHPHLKFDSRWGNKGVATSPNRKNPQAAVLDATSIRIVDLEVGKISQVLSRGGNIRWVFDRRACFSPTGDYLITPRYDEIEYDKRYGRLESVRWSHDIRHETIIWQVDHLSNGGLRVGEFPSKRWFLTASPDGKYFAFAEGGKVVLTEAPRYWNKMAKHQGK